MIIKNDRRICDGQIKLRFSFVLRINIFRKL